MSDERDPGQRIIRAELLMLRLAVILGEIRDETNRGEDASLYHIEKATEDAFDTLLEFFEGDEHGKENQEPPSKL